MNPMNRRDACRAVAAFAALGGLALPTQAEKTSDPEKDHVLCRSETFSYDHLPVTNLPNGGTMRRVLSGVLVTGEYIEVHESMLPPGKMPHPPHRHRNSEILFIREGTLEFLNDGKPEPVGPGGVVLTASNILHGLRNVGDTPATYFVVAIGRPMASS
jgi:mannose-6-phosphate isomerase-like protein (cupin superfamily)